MSDPQFGGNPIPHGNPPQSPNPYGTPDPSGAYPQQPTYPQELEPQIVVTSSSKSTGARMVNNRRTSMKGKARTVRIVLIVIGLLSIVIGGATYASVPNQVDGDIDASFPGVPQARLAIWKQSEQRDAIVRERRVVPMIEIGVGVVLLVAAAFVRSGETGATGKRR